MPIPLVGQTFLAKNKQTYVISQVIPQDTNGVFTIHSNSQVPPNYHKKIPATGGLEESRFAIIYDDTILGWREKT